MLKLYDEKNAGYYEFKCEKNVNYFTKDGMP